MDSVSKPQKILILLLGAIGDVTRALPLALRIKAAWPECSLHWAVEPKSAGVLEGHPAIDKVIVFERQDGIRGYWRFIKSLRAENYPLVLDLQRILKSGLASRFSGARQRLGFHPLDSKEFNWIFNNSYIGRAAHLSPKIYHYQLFGDALGVPPAAKLEFGLTPTATAQAGAEQLLQKVAAENGIEVRESTKRMALILGSSWASRFWFVAHYADLIRQAQKLWDFQAVLVGGPGEQEFAAELVRAVPNERIINLVDQTSLSELLAVLANVRVAVGPDSGPMHLAAAVNTPVISLWGSTSPKRSRPEGSENLVLQSAIGCSPCYKRECPGLGRLCMLDIPSEAVIARIGSILG